MLKLWKFALITLVTSHWLACMWVLITVLQSEAECNWVNHYFGGAACVPLEVHISNWEQYVAALCKACRH